MDNTPTIEEQIGTLQDLEDSLRRDAAGKLLQADSVALAITKLSENLDLSAKVDDLQTALLAVPDEVSAAKVMP